MAVKHRGNGADRTGDLRPSNLLFLNELQSLPIKENALPQAVAIPHIVSGECLSSTQFVKTSI